MKPTTVLLQKAPPIYRRMQLGYVDWKDAYKYPDGLLVPDQHSGTVDPLIKKKYELLQAIIPCFAAGDKVTVIMYPNTQQRAEIRGTVAGYKVVKDKRFVGSPLRFILGVIPEGKKRATYIYLDPELHTINLSSLKVESAITTERRQNPVEALLVRNDGHVFFQIINESYRTLPSGRKRWLDPSAIQGRTLTREEVCALKKMLDSKR